MSLYADSVDQKTFIWVAYTHQSVNYYEQLFLQLKTLIGPYISVHVQGSQDLSWRMADRATGRFIDLIADIIYMRGSDSD